MESNSELAIVHSGAGKPIKVLMVCLGNICRSPTAHGVLEKLIADRGLIGRVAVDSAGTANYHVGKHPDPRSIAAASLRGVDLSAQVSRQINSQDFEKFNHILAMDSENLSSMLADCPQQHKSKLQLLLSFNKQGSLSVPDPYYSADDGFEEVLDLVELACEQFLEYLIELHSLSALRENFAQ